MINIVLIFLMISLSARAQEPPQVSIADQAHRQITSKIHVLANNLDSFFGDKRADDEFGRSRMRLTYSYTIRQEHLPDQDTQFRFNLSLPNLQKIFRYHRDNKKNKTVNAKSEEDKIIEKLEKDPWISTFDSGINVSIPPQVFARYRLRKNWRYDNLIPRFIYEFGWFSNQGVIQTTGMNLDRRIQENLLLRFVNETNWNLTHHNFTTSHGPSLLHSFEDKSALSYNVRAASIVDEGSWYFNNYNLNVTYRHNLSGSWFFGEISPGLDFPKNISYTRSPYILFRLEALFG